MKSILGIIFVLLFLSMISRIFSVKHSEGAYQISIKDGSNCSCEAKPAPKIKEIKEASKQEIPAQKKSYDKAEIF